VSLKRKDKAEIREWACNPRGMQMCWEQDVHTGKKRGKHGAHNYVASQWGSKHPLKAFIARDNVI
jgi:hypothetical protein